jgi:hypothetical protein
MTGADIIGAMLRADAALLAIVAETRIKEDLLPDDIALPAIVVRSISQVDRRTLAREAKVQVTERVEVTVRAKSVRERKAVLKLVRRICAHRIGTMDEAENYAVLTDGLGPSLLGPGNSFERAQDFRVSFTTPR